MVFACIEFACSGAMTISRNDPPLVVIGSVNADIYVEVERLPEKGETIAASNGQTLPGGKGANQAACAGRLGYPTYFIGQVRSLLAMLLLLRPIVQNLSELGAWHLQVGQDGHGKLVMDALAASSNVNLKHVTNVKDVATGHAVVMLQPGGQNSIIIVGGANLAWPSSFSSDIQKLIKRAGALLLQREIPDSVNLEAAKVRIDRPLSQAH